MALRDFAQTITYWAISGKSGYGGYNFDSPITFTGRWEDRSELFRTRDGDERVSKSVIFSPIDLDIGGYLALGDYSANADPTIISDAFEIQMFSKISDLGALEFTRKAVL